MNVVGLGAGGHSRVLIDALRLRGVDVAALTDPNEQLWNSSVEGVPVVGDDSMWSSMLAQGLRYAFIGVGGVGDIRVRRSLYEKAIAAGFEIISVIHPTSVVAASAQLGKGVQIMACAIVNPGAVIGDDVIVNTAAVIEHDCVVGAHSHIATGAKLAGTVRIGSGAHIGIGAAIRQCIDIGDEAVVGAGAAVIRDVPARTTVVGVPAVAIDGDRNGRRSRN